MNPSTNQTINPTSHHTEKCITQTSKTHKSTIMSQREPGVFPFQALSRSVRQLDQACRHYMEVMYHQLNAIIRSDADKIMALSEKSMTAQEVFQSAEQHFVHELRQCLPEPPEGESKVTLEVLKGVWPEYALYIEEWQNQIARNVARLQDQQLQLLKLLEFAQARNADLIHTVYEMRGNKGQRYSQKGEKTGPSTGMAINQEG